MPIENLWGDEFALEEEKEKTKKIIKKISKPKELKEVTVEKKLKSVALSLNDKLNIIKENVLRILGKQKENVLVIRTKEELHDYISKCIQTGRIDIDTETNNSLDPITCKLMGPCFYAPGLKQAYVPINHRNPETKERLSWQLTEGDIQSELQRIIDNKTFVITHNGKFDYEVIKCTCNGIEIPLDWDTMIAYHLIDDNSFTYKLKDLYIKLIDPEQEKYDIEHLFEGVEYADVDPEIFALYAATDSFLTDKLYEYEYSILAKPEYSRVLKLLQEIEMPCVQVTAEMELNGVNVDMVYAEKLKDKYHKKLENVDLKLSEFLKSIEPQINAWKLTKDATEPYAKKQTQKQYDKAKQGSGFEPEKWTFKDGSWYKVGKSKLEQLDEVLTPDSLGSTNQLGIILYDILGCPKINKEKPYATGEDELIALQKYSPLCSIMLERRELVKLISTYIDTIPELAKRWPDGRVRTHFNQYGAATGRFSSSDPINLQNIPSHNKELRLLFRASQGNILIGGDYSQQEPKTLAAFSQDENMLNSYLHGKDLYSLIASIVYHNKYEDNLEHYQDGSLNPEGKKRRTNCKSILLGLLYGRGVASIAEQINSTVEEAQDITNKFFKEFPKIKKWIDESELFAKTNGYVEDFWGRRRRLPDIQLPRFTIRYKDEENINNLGDFNPFIGCKNRTNSSNLINKYKADLDKAKSRKQIEDIKLKADKDGIEIINNGGFISAAQRQCVNARIQGSAATMTKMAMVRIFRDKRLKDLGFKLLIGVHDELIGECLIENAEEATKLFTEDMRLCGEESLKLPFKVDADLSFNWYFNELCSIIKKLYLENLSEGLTPKESFDNVVREHSELDYNNLIEVVFRDFTKEEKEEDWMKKFKEVCC